MSNDYRNTEYCPALEKVEEKKNELQKNILCKHPRQKNMYNKIKLRESEFNKQFFKIYNYKCAYCGVSLDILPKALFEVDHYIAESLFNDKSEAGKVENLVLACYQCNRNKSSFTISGDYVNRLNTDNGNITNIFYRNDKYYICINKSFQKDKMITEFYDKLKLYHQSHRIDYLLLSMNGLHNKIDDERDKAILSKMIISLQHKRNKFFV